ncbi:MAG: hypothetical protein ABH821_03640 [archaeon]
MLNKNLNKRYWYFDAAPLANLGLSSARIKDIDKLYVVGGLSGNLAQIQKLAKDLTNFVGKKPGRKIVRCDETLVNTVNLLCEHSLHGVSYYGTIFYHNELPELLRDSPESYQSSDNPNEIGIQGMQGRTFAQTIWLPLQNFKHSNLRETAVVWVDNENPKIIDCLKFHFKNQFPSVVDGVLKVQSRDKAKDGEGSGHLLSDIIASIQSRAIISNSINKMSSQFLKKSYKFNSKIIVDDKTNKMKHVTWQDPKNNWDVIVDTWKTS